MSKNILVIHGPNINLTGTRKLEIYGSTTFDMLNDNIKKEADKFGLSCEIFQSNCEGTLIDKIHEARGNVSAIILNAGAYTHYSYAIRDAIEAVEIPCIEVHISNIFGREDFRSKSVIAPVCLGQVSGFDVDSYLIAVSAAARLI